VAKRAESVILKMELADSIEMFVPVNQVIRRYFLEGRNMNHDECM
jgi:hypothetical protein